jgi:hypothetical protein
MSQEQPVTYMNQTGRERLRGKENGTRMKDPLGAGRMAVPVHLSDRGHPAVFG